MSDSEMYQRWLDHEKRLTRIESYMKLIAAEVPIGVTIIGILVAWFAHL
jgi:hypothetical protein